MLQQPLPHRSLLSLRLMLLLAVWVTHRGNVAVAEATTQGSTQAVIAQRSVEKPDSQLISVTVSSLRN